MKTLIEIIETIGPSLASHVEEEEIIRRPSPITLKTLKENGLLKLFLPRSLGGLETDPMVDDGIKWIRVVWKDVA